MLTFTSDTKPVDDAQDPGLAEHVARGKPNTGDPTDLVKSSPVGQVGNGLLGDKGAGKKDKDDDKGSLRIHIELDLDVEIHLTARVKGDITIGLL